MGLELTESVYITTYTLQGHFYFLDAACLDGERRRIHPHKNTIHANPDRINHQYDPICNPEILSHPQSQILPLRDISRNPVKTF